MKRLSLILCTIIINVAVLAQSQGKPATETTAPKQRLIFVSEYTIKPGMMGEFLAWAKNEARPLFVKAGIREGYFFTNVYGDTSIATFAEVHDDFAALKERNAAFGKNNSPEALAALTAGTNRFIVHTHTYIGQSLPELSWRNPKLSGPPPYVVLTHRWITPFRTREYEDFIKNDSLPLLKKAEANGQTVSRTRFGGGPSEYFIFTPLYDLAELDQPGKVVQMAGADNMTKLYQKLVGVVQRTETTILRLRPELSILPQPTTAEKK